MRRAVPAGSQSALDMARQMKPPAVTEVGSRPLGALKRTNEVPRPVEGDRPLGTLERAKEQTREAGASPLGRIARDSEPEVQIPEGRAPLGATARTADVAPQVGDKPLGAISRQAEGRVESGTNTIHGAIVLRRPLLTASLGPMQKLRLLSMDLNVTAGYVPTADGNGGYGWGPPGSLGGLNIPVWAPNTFYPQSYVIQETGGLYSHNAAGTSGSTWAADQSNWTAFAGSGGGGGGGGLTSPIDGGAPSGSTFADTVDGGIPSTASFTLVIDGGSP